MLPTYFIYFSCIIAGIEESLSLNSNFCNSGIDVSWLFCSEKLTILLSTIHYFYMETILFNGSPQIKTGSGYRHHKIPTTTCS